MNLPARAATTWLASSAVGLGVVAALGALPTVRLAGRAGLVAAATGCAVALAGAAAGAAAVVLALARGTVVEPHAVAGRAMALRAGVSLAATLVVALGTGVARAPFLIWVGVAYGALLVTETRWTLRWLAAGTR